MNTRIVSIFLCLALIGCSSGPQPHGTWLNESARDTEITSALVIGAAGLDGDRKAFERDFCTALKARGVNAVPSFEQIPSLLDLNDAAISKLIRNTDATHVLVARATGMRYEMRSTELDNFGGLENLDRGFNQWWESVERQPLLPEAEMTVEYEIRIFESSTQRNVFAGMSTPRKPTNLSRVLTDGIPRMLLVLEEFEVVKH